MYIKVDYSIKRKSPEGRPDMPGEFAIFTKKHWWNKWIEDQTYADLEWAKRDAQQMRDRIKKEKELPIYF